MKLSVVVPAYNEEKLLRGSLRAIRGAMAAAERRGWETELVVCDNNSNDRTGGIAREEGAVVVREPENQISRARNRGAEAATGDWLLFVDADSQPSPALFEDMIDALESGDVLGGGCTLRLEERAWLVRVALWGWTRLSRWRRWPAGSFCFCRADAFREEGGFSLELYAGEEVELFRRLKRRARRERERIVILRKHPMLTSGRKVRLYSAREWGAFVARAVLGLGRPLRDREACGHWYDGRR